MTTRVWTGCADGTTVRVVELGGVGHDWPAGVAAELWAFFEQVPPVPDGP
ncbi:MAG: hypothetical protein R2690_05300 [Acidimicrobiales bacterium]